MERVLKRPLTLKILNQASDLQYHWIDFAISELLLLTSYLNLHFDIIARSLMFK